MVLCPDGTTQIFSCCRENVAHTYKLQGIKFHNHYYENLESQCQWHSLYRILYAILYYCMSVCDITQRKKDYF